MKFSITTIASLASLIFLTQANPITLAALTEGDITRVGPITPGGPNVTLSGSAESIYKQILQLNPDYNPADHGGVVIPTLSGSSPAKRAAEALSRLEGRSPTGGCCRCLGAPYNGEAWQNSVVTGIAHVFALGSATCSTGNSGVARLYCSNASGIFMVNSRQASISASCTYIGQLLQGLYRDCGTADPSSENVNYGHVNGQECDSTGFCVIVSGC